MIRSTIIFLLISCTLGENLDLNKVKLSELERSFNEAENYMTKEASGVDAVIFLGMVNAGTKPLINYLIGNKLRGVKYSPYGEYKIIKADNRSQGPEICDGFTSETKIPTKWISDKFPGLSMFDFPGFDDNRDPVQDITNSFYLYHLVKKVKSLKFILVINFVDIERSNVNPLLKSLLYSEKLFGNKFEKFFSSISVIVSKVPRKQYGTKVDIEMIDYILKQKADIGTEMFKNVKNFLIYITENNDRIGLFRRPENNNTITSDIDFNIFSAIRNSRSIQGKDLQDVLPTISDRSIIYLMDVPKVAIREIYYIRESLYNIFSEILSEWEKLVNQNNEAIPQFKRNLSYIENLLHNSVANETNIYENIKTIEKIDINMKKKIDESNLLTKIEMLMLFSNILNTNEDLNNFSKHLISWLQNQITNAIHNVELLIASATEYPELTTDITENLTENTEQSTDVTDDFEGTTENITENSEQSTVIAENPDDITEDSIDIPEQLTEIAKNSTDIPEYIANDP